MKTTTLSIAAAAAALTFAFTEPVSAPAPVAGSFTGTVLLADAGKVVFEGEKPEVKPLSIDPTKAEGCGTVDTQDQSLIVGEKGGIANVVVIVEVEGKEVKPLDKPFVLDQKSCRFEPHVAIVPAGSTVEFHNSDKVTHNVHTYPGKNDSMNQMISPEQHESRKLEKEDRIRIGCDIHPWMNSWLVVADSNFFAVTGTDGSFKIDGLPAGEHKVSYWHEKLGKESGKIKVGEDGKIEPVEVKMSAEKKKSGGRGR